MTGDALEWRLGAANLRVIRVVWYGWVSLFFALPVLVVAGAVYTGSQVSGPETWVFVLFLLIGGPFSALYLWQWVGERGPERPLSWLVYDPAPDPEESLEARYRDAFSRTGIVVATVTQVVFIVGALWVDPRLLAAYIVSWFIILPLASLVTVWGRLEPADKRLRYRSSDIDLETIERVRPIRVGPLVCCRMHYVSGTTSLTTPSLVVFTPQVFNAFHQTLERCETVPPTGSPRRGVQAVAVAVGAGLILTGAGLWYWTEIPHFIGLYLMAVLGTLGLVFLWAGTTVS